GMSDGEVSEPLRASGGYYVLQLVSRQAGRPAMLAEVRDQVVAEYRREAGERAVERHLENLRRNATIETRRTGQMVAEQLESRTSIDPVEHGDAGDVSKPGPLGPQ